MQQWQTNKQTNERTNEQTPNIAVKLRALRLASGRSGGFKLPFTLSTQIYYFLNPLALQMDIYSLALFSNVNILWTKKGNIGKYTTFCGGINEDGERKSKKK